jgi:hypothetical protein
MEAHAIRSRLVVWFLLSIVALSHPVHGQQVVTVILKDGTTRPQSSCLNQPAFGALLLQHGTEQVQVSYSDVDAILDAAGANIAPALLGKRYRPAGLDGSTRPARSIELASGARLDRFRYALNPLRRELIVYEGAPPQAIPYESIRSIHDEQGVEVTDAVLSGPAPPAGAAPSGTPQAGAPGPAAPGEAAPAVSDGLSRGPVAAPPWRVAVALSAGLDLPLGEYYEGTKGGLGYGGILHLAVTDNLALRGGATLLGIAFEDGFGLVSLDPNLTILSQDYDIDAWRWQVGLEYWGPLSRWSPRSGFWFVHSSLGAIRHGLDGRATVRSESTSEVFTAVASTSDSRFTMTSGVGLIYLPRPHVGLTLSSDIDFVWTKVYYSNGGTGVGIKGFVPGIRLGVALLQ